MAVTSTHRRHIYVTWILWCVRFEFSKPHTYQETATIIAYIRLKWICYNILTDIIMIRVRAQWNSIFSYVCFSPQCGSRAYIATIKRRSYQLIGELHLFIVVSCRST